MAARERRRTADDGLAAAQPKLKRKRDGGNAQRIPSKKLKPAHREDVAVLVENQLRQENNRSIETSVERDTTKAPSPAPRETVKESSESSESSRPSSLSPLQQKIEEQFSLEILLKHQELRLIEQELAKCQIALEQIRRCELIPYPALLSTPETNEQVRTGAGPPAIEADFAPAWGITEGPYARHYARWLLPDPSFDGPSAEDDLRFLRQDSNISGKTRPHRGNAGKLQALSGGLAAPKEKNGPLLVRRASDGQLVKLVCLDCHRGDFSSAQGFINHCRIAHHRSFDSHDAAANECGQEIDADDLNLPDRSEVSSLVHPLNRPHLDEKTQLPELPVASSNPTKPLAPFLGVVESDKTPYLNAFLAQRRIELNLRDIVADAEEHVELSDSSDDEDEMEDVQAEALGESASFGGRRMPFRSGMSPAPYRPGSKGSDTISILHEPDILSVVEHGLSPQMSESTTESNTAPSLVSDDDDEYEHTDTSSHTTVESEDDVVDIALEDEAESELSSPKRPTLRGKSDRLDGGSRMRLRKEDRHVTFVSPAPSVSPRRTRRR